MGSQVRAFALAFALAAASVVVAASESIAHAEDAPDAFARVVTDSADLRTGPGATFRVLSTASRGDTFILEGRAGNGFWLRVRTDDGRIGYVLGDEVQTFAVKPGEPDAPSRPGFFAPPPLANSRAGFAILAGALRTKVLDGTHEGFGYLEVKPQLVVHETVSLEGFFGNALTSDGSQLLYGGGVTVHLAPRWAFCPFVGLGGGGLSVLPNSDSFVLQREDLGVARAGGGVMFAIRGRILVRLEATNLTLFSADVFRNAQTFAGGLGVYF